MSDFDKVTKARARLILSRPFYGVLALRMRVQPREDIRTAATDGRTFFYNPAWVNKLPLDQVMGLWAHECLHPAMLHHIRRKGREHTKWNVACDFAINPILKEDGMSLPSEGCYDPKWAGMSAEEIYAQLPDFKDMSQFGNSDDPGGCGSILDAPGGTGQSQAEIEQDWKQAVAQAAHAARMQGKLPAGLERLIGEILYTPTPWRDILRRFINEKSNEDYTWNRPNRRHIANGLYFPTAYSESMGPIVVAIDTSGSIGQHELNTFGAELNQIVQDAAPKRIHRVFCDAAVARADDYGPHDEIPWKGLGNIGGGGTAFEPVFDWVAEQGLEPRCLVYLTDMYGSFPQDPPDYPVLWASISKDVTGPFGDTVLIDMSQEHK